MKLALIFFNLIVISACVPTKVKTEITSGKINKDAPFEWSGNFPLTLQISEQFSSDEVASIEAMSTAWETSLANKNFFDHGETKAKEVSSPNMNLDGLGKDGISGIYKIKNWPSGLPGTALAVTQIFGIRYNIGTPEEYVNIEHADILLNDHLYGFRTHDSINTDEFDLKTVILHEMGHFLGLGHKYADSVMIPEIGPGTNMRSPTHIDVSDLAQKYGITLVTSKPMAFANRRKINTPNFGDEGLKVKILIELMAEGECIHTENGVEVKRHSVQIK